MFTFLLTFFVLVTIHAQNDRLAYCGIYGNWLNGVSLSTELELKENGTFHLKTVDYVYPQTFKSYTNQGEWTIVDKEVILNPTLQPHEPKVKIKEKHLGLKDSIRIKIIHQLEVYENQKLQSIEEKRFDLLTLYFNKKRNRVHLTREDYQQGSCAWAPRIKHRMNIDESNIIQIPKREINKIGIYTYGFTDYVEIPVNNPTADYYEINITLPIDRERMPRSKKVIIKGKRAYYYEVYGKVKKSLSPLIRKS